jgi:hypothetical protein
MQSGCYEAQLQAAALLGCVIQACGESCQDLGSTGCLACVAMSCGGNAMACYSGTCGPTDCGDSSCQAEEDCTSCPEDCGACPDTCGDGECQLYEDCSTCELDCGPCFWCGDAYCDPEEDCESCPDDCGRCPILCGDGICEQLLGESCANCPQDCECGGITCGEIVTCFATCQDLLCPNTCLAEGCYEAQQQAHSLLRCLITGCLLTCLNPSSPECQDCLMSTCGGEMVACLAGRCEE